jgi:hypothetical protein
MNLKKAKHFSLRILFGWKLRRDFNMDIPDIRTSRRITEATNRIFRHTRPPNNRPPQ